MKMTIESTDQVVQIVQNGVEVPARVWEGTTAKGVYVQVLVTRIAAPTASCQGEFEKDLKTCRPPEQRIVFPLRMVL